MPSPAMPRRRQRSLTHAVDKCSTVVPPKCHPAGAANHDTRREHLNKYQHSLWLKRFRICPDGSIAS